MQSWQGIRVGARTDTARDRGNLGTGPIEWNHRGKPRWRTLARLTLNRDMTSDKRGPVVSTSGLEAESRPSTSPGLSRAGASVVRQVVVAALLLPFSAIVFVWALIMVTNNLDVAYALGVPDDFVTGLVVGVAGLVAGLGVVLVSRLRGWRLVGPPAAGLVVGVGICLGFVAFERGAPLELAGLALITIGTGQLIAIVAAARLTGPSLAGVLVGVVGLGVGSASLLQAIPPPPAEVLLILDVYQVEQSTGECSGAGELAGIGKGSEVVLLEAPESSGMPTELGFVVLPAGTENDGSCRFELGNPLNRPVDGYANIDFHPESDPNVPYSIASEGNRVIVNLEHAEG